MILCGDGCFAFGLVWHMWWMVILFLVAALATMISRGFARDTNCRRGGRSARNHRAGSMPSGQPPFPAAEGEPANAGLAPPRTGGRHERRSQASTRA